MILIEENRVEASQLPMEQFRAHLRLGTGFDNDDLQDQVLEGYLRAALSAVEGRTSQAIFQRNVTWIITEWHSETAQPFTLSPIRMVNEVRVFDGGETYEYGPDQFYIWEDALAPELRPVAGKLPVIPTAGKAEVSVLAGMATEWAQVPPDLAQALLLLASHYYEYRNEVSLSRGCAPFGVTALLERYRPMRISMRSSQ